MTPKQRHAAAFQSEYGSHGGQKYRVGGDVFSALITRPESAVPHGALSSLAPDVDQQTISFPSLPSGRLLKAGDVLLGEDGTRVILGRKLSLDTDPLHKFRCEVSP